MGGEGGGKGAGKGWGRGARGGGGECLAALERKGAFFIWRERTHACFRYALGPSVKKDRFIWQKRPVNVSIFEPCTYMFNNRGQDSPPASPAAAGLGRTQTAPSRRGVCGGGWGRPGAGLNAAAEREIVFYKRRWGVSGVAGARLAGRTHSIVREHILYKRTHSIVFLALLVRGWLAAALRVSPKYAHTYARMLAHRMCSLTIECVLLL